MPRYEASALERKRNPIIPVVYILGLVYFFFSVILFFESASGWNTFNMVISLSLMVYIVGRIYGDLNVKKDFIEITPSSVKFRSTPAFGEGWLPVSKDIPFDQIRRADIAEISPFYNPEEKRTCLAIYTMDREYLIGTALEQEQLIKVGLALKGSVTISKTLGRFLGKSSEEVGDQLKDIIDVGKTIWKSFKDKQDPNKGTGQ